MANKLDLVFKKAVNRQYTSASKNWYNEDPGIPYKLKGSDVWIESIPAVAPSVSNSMIRVFDLLTLTKDNTVAANGSWLAYDGGNRIGSFIAPRYGQSYTAVLYDATTSATGIGTYQGHKEVLTTHACGWFFDYETGILTFDTDPSTFTGVNAIASSAFYLKVWQYIGLTVDDMMSLDNTLGNLIVNPGTSKA